MKTVQVFNQKKTYSSPSRNFQILQTLLNISWQTESLVKVFIFQNADWSFSGIRLIASLLFPNQLDH